MPANLKHRYPGARSFEEYEGRLFFGRDKEIEELYRQIKVENHLVLYAKSGIGKTSLINAGIIPKLKAEAYFPIVIRFQELSQSPLELVFKTLAEFIPSEDKEKLQNAKEPLIWEYLKLGAFGQKETQKTPVLILDQFEELFNHPAEEVEKFSYQLSDLINERLPDKVQQAFQDIPRKKLKENPQLVNWYQPVKLKVIIAIRNSRLSLLDDLSDNIPSIFNNRYRLTPFKEDQARSAIIIPARYEDSSLTSSFQYEDKTVDLIIKNLENAKGDIEPFQLQVLCQFVEEKVKAAQEVDSSEIVVGPDYLGGKNGINNILNNYYENQISQIHHPPSRLKARQLIEEGLIVERRRVSLDESFIRSQYGIDIDLLNKLLLTRIIRVEATNLGQTYEISHDNLIEPVLKSYEIRFRRERRRKLIKNILFALLSLLAIGLIGYQIQSAITKSKRKTDRLLTEKQQFEQRVDSVTNLLSDLNFESEKALKSKEDTLAYLLSQLDEKINTLGLLNTTSAEQERIINNYRGYIDSLKQIIVTKDSSLTVSTSRSNQLESNVLSLREEVSQLETALAPYKQLNRSENVFVATEDGPLFPFDSELYKLDGILTITGDEVEGTGRLYWDQGELISRRFVFDSLSVQSDSMEIQIYDREVKDYLAFLYEGNGVVDFEARLAKFEPKNDEKIMFPFNQYSAESIKNITWDMDRGSLKFMSDRGKLGTFTSLRLDSDSLSFQSQEAVYELKTRDLELEGVPYIASSDALIFPKDNEIKVSSGGKIATLEDARIEINLAGTNVHVIDQANVEIKGRKEYSASGFYEYDIGDKEQRIEFKNIKGRPVGKGLWSQKRTVTRATGEVTIDDQFYIDHKTEFFGEISINGNAPSLLFDGFIRLDADNLPEKHWFSIKSEGNKKHPVLRYKEPKNPEGDALYTGLFLSKEYASIYPRVMMPLLFQKDRPIFTVEEVLKYNKEQDQFIFGSSSKIIANQLRGNRTIFDNKDGALQVEGKFNIGSGLKYVSVEAAGTAETRFTASSTNIGEAEASVNANLMAGIRLIIPEKLLKIIQEDFKSAGFNTSPIIYLADVEFYKNALAGLFPNTADTEFNEIIKSLNLGVLTIPKTANDYTFLFDKLDMKWKTDYQSFVSTEKNSGLVSIAGEMINQKIECYVEFRMPSNEDDRLYIYLKSQNDLFYFFGFKQGILSITSNNPTFMEELNDLKTKKQVTKMDDGGTYEIQAVEPNTALRFVRRTQAANK